MADIQGSLGLLIIQTISEVPRDKDLPTINRMNYEID